MLNWPFSVVILSRPEQLYIEDRRPTWAMLFSIFGAIGFSVAFVIRFFFGQGVGVDSVGMWVIGGLALLFVGLPFCGTVRERYVFDKPSDTYQFTRQFIYKKEVIEGTISLFRGVGVRTDKVDDSITHAAVVRQEGLLFGAPSEQRLRETKPAFNFLRTEARIAEAIHKVLDIPRVDSDEWRM